MKKILKYTLLAIVIIIAVCALLHQIFFAKTFEFVLAARDKDIPHMEQMIKDGYDPVADRYFGTGLLTYYIGMCLGNDVDIDLKTLTYLLDIGLSPDLVAKGKPTALQLVVFYNKPETVKLLIERGADINFEFKGQTTLDIAIRFQHFNLIKLFPLKNAKIGTFVGANPIYIENLLLRYMWDSKYRDVINLFLEQGYYTKEEIESFYKIMQTEIIENMQERNISYKDISRINQL